MNRSFLLPLGFGLLCILFSLTKLWLPTPIGIAGLGFMLLGLWSWYDSAKEFRAENALRDKLGKKLGPPNDQIEVLNTEGPVKRYLCGHNGPRAYSMRIFGQVFPQVPPDFPYCPDCAVRHVEETALRCARCGHVIFDGDPVAVYAPGSTLPYAGTGHFIPRGEPGEGHYLGCARWDCCPSGAFIIGHLVDKKVWPMFPGGRSAAATALATGQPVFGSV